MKKIIVILGVLPLLYGTGENWTQLSPSGTPPSGRWASAAVYDSIADRFVVFGGGTWSGAFNTTFALDSIASGNGVWRQLTPSGSIPSVRGFCGPVYDAPRRRMIIFGGYNMAGSCYNQVYFLDSIYQQSPRWTLKTVSGTPPSVRQSSAFAYDPIRERMIVFSGWCGFNWRNDIWVLDSLATNPRWRQLMPSGGGPGGRWGATCAYDYNRDRLIVFGGQNTSQQYPNAVWALDSIQSGDGRWVQLFPGGTAPNGRMWLASTFDAENDRLLIFGGGYFQSTTFNDLRSLGPLSSNPSWTQITATGTVPGPRYGPALALDAGHHRFILFGGNSGGTTGTNYNDVYTLTWNAGEVAENTDRLAGQPLLVVKPNPFHHRAVISMECPSGSISSAGIFDCQGQFIEKIPVHLTGTRVNLEWNGRYENGSLVPSGTYFLVVQTSAGTVVQRIIKVE